MMIVHGVLSARGELPKSGPGSSRDRHRPKTDAGKHAAAVSHITSAVEPGCVRPHSGGAKSLLS